MRSTLCALLLAGTSSAAPAANFDYSKDVPYLEAPNNLLLDGVAAGIISKAGLDQTFTLPATWSMVGYPARFTFSHTEPVVIHYAGDVWLEGKHLATVKVFDAVSRKQVLRQEFPPGSKPLIRQACRSFHHGCAFSEKVTIDPGRLAGGEYYAILTSPVESSLPIYFNVDRREPVNQRRVTVLLPNFTWHAYNRHGGGSLYGVGRPGPKIKALLDEFKKRPPSFEFGPPAPLSGKSVVENWDVEFSMTDNRLFNVSLQRPLFFHHESTTNIEHSPELSIAFLRELEKAGLPYRALTEENFHLDPSALNGVRVLVINGHSEYWTPVMRAAVDQFVERGGRIANFSGNLAQWRVGYTDGRLFLNHDDPPSPPAPAPPPEFTVRGSDNWPTTGPRTTAHTFCLGFPHGGYAARYLVSKQQLMALGLTAADYARSDALEVVEPTHAVFQNTGLRKGALLGAGTSIMGTEVDALPLRADGTIDFTHEPDLAGRVRLLATGYFYYEFARYPGAKLARKVAMGVECEPKANGGRVVSFGTIGFGIAMYQGNRAARRVFVNTVKYLLGDLKPFVAGQ